MIYFVRQNPMAAAVSGQKVNLTPGQFSTNEYVRRRSKRCVDFVFSRIAQLLHLVETAATDDTDRRNVFIHARRDLIPNGHDEKRIMCSWRTWRRYVLFSSVHAEILHQDLWLPDERARLRTGRAFARGAPLLKNLPHVDLVVGTQKFHRVADYVDELIKKQNGGTRPPVTPHRAMDDLRFSVVDVEEEAGWQSTIRDQQPTPRQATAFVSIMQGC